MYRLATTAAFATDDPFPSVNLISGLPGGSFGSDAVLSGTLSLNLIGALGPGDIMEPVATADGVYYRLDGHTLASPDQPIQPLFLANVSVSGWPVRSVVFKGGSYETLPDFDPVIVLPLNDYLYFCGFWSRLCKNGMLYTSAFAKAAKRTANLSQLAGISMQISPRSA